MGGWSAGRRGRTCPAVLGLALAARLLRPAAVAAGPRPAVGWPPATVGPASACGGPPAVPVGFTCTGAGRRWYPTCTVRTFVIRAVAQGADMVMGYADAPAAECFGDYLFVGADPTRRGYGATTWDDDRELAFLFRQWNPRLDGGVGATAWVNLAPALVPGLRRAGIDPLTLLQWVNEYVGGAPWPPWLPRPSPWTPGTVPLIGQLESPGLRASPALAVGAPAGAAPQAPAAAGGLGEGTAAGWSATRPTAPEAKASPVRPPAGGAVPSRPRGAATAGTAVPRRTAPSLRAAPPPLWVRWRGVVLPCVASAACRAAWSAFGHYRALPATVRLVWQLRWHARLFALCLAAVGAACLGRRRARGQRWHAASGAGERPAAGGMAGWRGGRGPWRGRCAGRWSAWPPWR